MTLQNLGLFLHHCAKAKALSRGVSLHAAAIKTGRLAETSMCNHILNFYAKCGLLHLAHQVFDEMPHRYLVTWSALISGYNLWDTPHKALQLFSEMHKHFKPNDSVFSSALSSCARSRDLNLGQQIHALAFKLSYCSMHYPFCDSSFVQPTLVSYNIAITGLVESKLQEKGMELFVELLRRGLLPDRLTFAGLLGAGETFVSRIRQGVQVYWRKRCCFMDRRAAAIFLEEWGWEAVDRRAEEEEEA
ncbi:putative pentatricopeptide repeat-containing protein At3g13770, mitochondrial [Salvia miltiorrhiza]|uniref:putative pentatricopeptide repeat-containing protein At3g13770, mitochondrial n=1 Tax=Salvia miltiorrhiza TaxID=226208 RepID=UPI0025AC61C1|nr:putative pentatricopeptide repeat-containing protein At3g13770, mitochondrial [Salvia miltiorrhiza]